ncbi:MAG TPA: HEAT repeat domain-containing protein [Waterburya sp.]|jgi:phycocyanobilin lyase alpha subunit
MSDFSPEASNEAASPPLTVEEAIANLRGTDLSLRYYAAWWLGKFRASSIEAVDALIEALEDDADRTELGGYPLRRNAARALGKLGDRRAVPGLIRSLECSDFYVREAAAQSLEMLGDPAAIPALMRRLNGGLAAAERVPERPHLREPCEAIMEALGTLQAKEAIPLIEPFLEHSIKRVQYAATRAMYQLKRDDVYGRRLVEALKGEDVVLRRVALSDLGAIGYLPAAEAITTAPAENSFKLMALKGLLEHQLDIATDSTLADDAIRVMNLMDSLL